MVVLDTDILVAFLRGIPEAIAEIERFYHENLRVITTSVTLFELFGGVHTARDSEKKIRDVESLIDDMDILYFDTQSSRIVGKMYSELKRKGKLIDIVDQFIAGIVIAHNETLVTRNIKHFSAIDDLNIQTW